MADNHIVEPGTRAPGWKRPGLVRLSSGASSEGGILKGFKESEAFPTKGGGNLYGYTPTS